ncbi:MAG: hypothetical protein F4Y88_00360 [Chloroflexi bacterium]|nr:hypothetical protein [Chloroflexota bacterium]
MQLSPDEGVVGVCTTPGDGHTGLHPADVSQLQALVVGEDPLKREYLYQKLHQGTRWVYRSPSWFGGFDNCLWDIAGKVAGMPVYSLLGKVRDEVHAYYNTRGATIEEAVEDAQRALDLGFVAVKDHFYHPVEENIRWLTAIREAVGDEIDCMHDPVAIYTFEEALKVGRALEDLDYRWFEEPLPERSHNLLVRLASALDIPIMATETFMYDTDLCAQYLISGATDLIRQNARHGTTNLMKLAHLAELHGTNVELNGPGGLYGLVHAHLLCCIQNTSYYEFFPGGHLDLDGEQIGLLNPVVPIKGKLSPPDGPGWGAEWDWKQFEKRTVEVVE